MYEPSWKRLVESLRASKFESPYLDRLSERLRSSNLRSSIGWQSLEREMLEEMATALGRAEDKINLALLELELAGRAIDEASDRAARTAAVAAFNDQRDRAVQARWELLVHREALGFYRNEELERYYPIPPPRRV